MPQASSTTRRIAARLPRGAARSNAPPTPKICVIRMIISLRLAGACCRRISCPAQPVCGGPRTQHHDGPEWQARQGSSWKVDGGCQRVDRQNPWASRGWPWFPPPHLRRARLTNGGSMIWRCPRSTRHVGMVLCLCERGDRFRLIAKDIAAAGVVLPDRAEDELTLESDCGELPGWRLEREVDIEVSAAVAPAIEAALHEWPGRAAHERGRPPARRSLPTPTDPPPYPRPTSATCSSPSAHGHPAW